MKNVEAACTFNRLLSLTLMPLSYSYLNITFSFLSIYVRLMISTNISANISILEYLLSYLFYSVIGIWSSVNKLEEIIYARPWLPG